MDDGIIYIYRKSKKVAFSFTFEDLEKIADEQNTLALMIVNVMEDEEQEE